MQCIALVLAACSGLSHTLSALAASLMSALTLNIILSMKAAITVFDSNPVVQDFWVAQNQLFLLVTSLPIISLFGKWNNFGTATNALLGAVWHAVKELWMELHGGDFCDKDDRLIFGGDGDYELTSWS